MVIHMAHGSQSTYTCKDKVKFATKEEAQAKIDEHVARVTFGFNDFFSPSALVVYGCKKHKCYHIGHPLKGREVRHQVHDGIQAINNLLKRK